MTERVERHGIGALHVDVRTAPTSTPHRTLAVDPRAGRGGRPARARARAGRSTRFAALGRGRGRDARRRPRTTSTSTSSAASTRSSTSAARVVAARRPRRRRGRLLAAAVRARTVRAAHGVLPLARAGHARAAARRAARRRRGRRRARHADRRRARGGARRAGFGPLPALVLERVGYGAGTRDLPERPNVVRVLIGQAAERRPAGARSSLLETNLDDLLPELVPDAVERCFAAGALDVWTVPVQMKKGRPGIVLSALARPADERAVAAAILEETSALGVRVAHGSAATSSSARSGRSAVDGEHDPREDRPPRRPRRQRRARARRLRRRSPGGTGRSVKSVWAAALARPRQERDEPNRRARAADRLARTARSSPSRAASTPRSSPRSPRGRSAAGRSPSPRSRPRSPTGELDGRAIGRRGRRHRARDDLDRRAGARGLPSERPRPLLPLQDRALRAARGARAAPRLRGRALRRQRRRRGRLAPRPARGRRARRRPPAARGRRRQGRGARARRASSASRAPASRPRPASPRACPTAPRSTPSSLRQVDRAELALKALGYPVVRVRHYGELGRVEIAADDLPRALAGRVEVEAAVRAAGYAAVEIDEEPFRSGSLNRFTTRLPVLG